MEEIYENYFLNQYGGLIGDIGPLYKSNKIYQRGFGFHPITTQHGQGIGSFFQNLYNIVYPLIRSGVSSLGSEMKTAGKNIIKDIATKPISTLIEEHGNEAISNLKNKAMNKIKTMQGKGVKKKDNLEKKFPKKL